MNSFPNQKHAPLQYSSISLQAFHQERIIIISTFNIRDYYDRRVDPTKKDQFQEEIEDSYQLIYEELKKPSPYLMNLNLNKPIYSETEERDKRMILRQMEEVLGLEEMSDFIEKYKIDDLLIGTNKEALLKIMAMVGMFSFVFIIIMLFIVFF